MDLMIGAVTNRLLLGYAPLDEKSADAIVDTALCTASLRRADTDKCTGKTQRRTARS